MTHFTSNADTKNKSIEQIKNILKGSFKPVKDYIKAKQPIGIVLKLQILFHAAQFLSMRTQ